jgi:hypothetical protein
MGRRLLPAAVAGAVLVALVPGGAATAAGGSSTAPKDSHRIVKAPTDTLPAATMTKLRNAKLAKPTGATSTRTVSAAAGSGVDPIEMRVLVLATKGDPNPDGVHVVPAGSWDWNLSMLTDALEYIGEPYDTLKSTTKELCVNGSWEIDYAVDGTETACTSGVVVPWGTVTLDRLQENTLHAYYQGVMQTNGTLSYVDSAASFVSSALTADEWAALWAFEAGFGIRTVSANTYPTADFGLSYMGEDGTPTVGKWTAAGAAAFPYVNANGSLPIENSYTYRAATDPLDTTTVPLLTDSDGDVLAVTHTYPNQGNREVLALTFDSAGYLTHGQVLGFGLVSWVTKGLFLGDRHAYLDPQPDDIFIADSLWEGPNAVCANTPDNPGLPQYRIDGNDLTKALAWQKAKQGVPVSKALRLELPFNGEGTTATYLAEQDIARDTLTPAAKKNQASFKWVNHTYSHQNMDFQYVTDAQVSTSGGVSSLTSATFNLSNAWGQAVAGTGIPAGTTVVNVLNASTVELSQPAATSGSIPDATVGTTSTQATSEINLNLQVASQLGLSTFTKANLIQPDISGLNNPFFLGAAKAAGVKYMISDTSRTGDPARYGVNEGRYNGTEASILEVARYPVNLYFNVSTPQQWLAEDNCLYPSGAAFGHVDTYAQLLDRESDVLVRYLLHGHNRPLMFHQPNLRAYDGTHSLLGDLIDATMAKYGDLVTVPLVSPTMNQLGVDQADRMVYNDAWKNGGLTGSIVPGKSITLTSSKAATVPITGTNAGKPYTVETYAGQKIAYIPVKAGQPVTVPIR